MAKVTLGFGSFELAEPSFAGWNSILTALPAEEYDTVRKIILEVWHSDFDQDQDAVERVTNLAMPMISRLPWVAAAVIAACLWTDEGDPVDQTTVYNAPGSATDFLEFAHALVEHGVFSKLLVAAKNRFGLVLGKENQEGLPASGANPS